MKTEMKQAKRQANPSEEKEIFYVTMPSTMNYSGEPEEEQDFGYPDFYEDTDNMNRYLW